MLSFRISSPLVTLLISSVAQFASGSNDAELYPMLGINSFDELSYNYEVTVDEDCDFHFTVEFSHNERFPVGNADTCVPGVNADDYDGLPMLEGRWFWEEYPSYVQDATGMNHLSLDYNPCGHPTGGFLITHYDLHFYSVSAKYRADEMICEVIPGTPACYPEQSIASGKAFFALEEAASSSIEASDATNSSSSSTGTTSQLVNMPPGFASAISDAVIFMGMHSFDRLATPLSPEEWSEPTLVFVTHNSSVICFEPMLPFHFTIGDEDHFYQRSDIEYVEQTISTLPYQYEVSFDGATKVTTVSFSGKSNVCQAQFNAAKAAYEASVQSAGVSNNNQAADGVSSVVGMTTTGIALLAAGLLANMMVL